MESISSYTEAVRGRSDVRAFGCAVVGEELKGIRWSGCNWPGDLPDHDPILNEEPFFSPFYSTLPFSFSWDTWSTPQVTTPAHTGKDQILYCPQGLRYRNSIKNPMIFNKIIPRFLGRVSAMLFTRFSSGTYHLQMLFANSSIVRGKRRSTEDASLHLNQLSQGWGLVGFVLTEKFSILAS